MGKLTDAQIRAWIRKGERFSGRSDGNGLTLRFLPSFNSPAWRYRYRFGGKPRVMDFGSYREISLSKAREITRQFAAKVALGIDPKLEKSDNVKIAKQRIAEQSRTVTALCDVYFENRKIKTLHIERAKVVKDLLPYIGSLAVQEVNATHVQEILNRVKKRGAPTAANKLLRLATKVFNHGVKLQWISFNVWAAFEISDAGGTEKPRQRWLDDRELRLFLSALANAEGWSFENDSAVRLLLMLGVRKMELIGARCIEFNLDEGRWHLPGERTKTGQAIAVPLPQQAIDIIGLLIQRNGYSDYLFPARKLQTRMLPHISPDTINASLKRFINVDIPPFTVHDLRRTCRTHIEKMGFDSRIGESILNHKIKGVEGVYNQHSYFEERKKALQAWADHLSGIEAGI